MTELSRIFRLTMDDESARFALCVTRERGQLQDVRGLCAAFGPALDDGVRDGGSELFELLDLLRGCLGYDSDKLTTRDQRARVSSARG